jgi:hypothetical protein
VFLRATVPQWFKFLQFILAENSMKDFLLKRQTSNVKAHTKNKPSLFR